MIPYRLFWQMYGDLARIETGSRLENGFGVALGISIGVAAKDPKTKGLIRRYKRRAYPEVDDLEEK